MSTAQAMAFTLDKIYEAMAKPGPVMRHLINPHYFVILSRETDAPVREIGQCHAAGLFRLTGIKRDDVKVVNSFFNEHCNHIDDLLAAWVASINQQN
jgi:UDP-N-acetylmuramyl pentapeptide synthase